MTIFWILAATMVLVAFGLLLPSLMGRRNIVDTDRDEQNVRIARERLAELEAERDGGVISEAQFEQARRELEQALLNDVAKDSAAARPEPTRGGRWATGVVVLAVPVLATWLYLYLGKPDAIEMAAAPVASAPPGHTAADGGTGDGSLPSLEEMTERLAVRLEQNPDDAQGWFMLGRTYMSMARYAEAADAFERLHALVGDDPAVLLRYADALAMASGGRISGKPFALIQRALELDPNDMTALWLGGMGYEEQGDYETAVTLWRRLEPLLQEDPASLAEVREMIARAEQQLGRPVSAQPPVQASAQPQQATAAEEGAASITVLVALDSQFAETASPDDTVFIYARALEGPPMPLAVARRRVSDLPLRVTLDDSMAMTPAMRLSNFSEVRVSARVSQSGNAMPQSGDLKGEVAPVVVAAEDPVRVMIDQVLP